MNPSALTLAPDSTHVIHNLCVVLKFRRTTSGTQLCCLFDGNDLYHALAAVSTETSNPEVAGHSQVDLTLPFLISRNNGNAAPRAQSCRDHQKALVALGTLIHGLWFGQPLEAQRSWRANFGPDGRETEFTKFNAAAAWQETIGAHDGPIMHNITQRCIYGNFGPTLLSLEDTELIKAVYENVVLKLQMLCKVFD
ncbi:hypothetical protein SMACR_09461 [Sordaria macrospora]|uniref:WGS project CABT00000000 data, contig 2.5 n=2 Tax=Sordaria macrospora TaxID=5147 RepID=F7VRG1_SORMK|nr:uncharacterized protein SMAC_09461 [Sordaria macrospora k-hell]KAA8628153.1 hypothetical protein SMACR_09461 [Sordaria macrospora]WPJ61340.1 hypothetical protein SMAC4_09461 [Sordaria macrospora]CCC08096.1 unnamed protein product [Sordaria macrospora k-hell]